MRRLLLCMLLAGCASQPPMGERIAQKCESLGFQRGTEAFGNCYMQTQQQVLQTAGQIHMPQVQYYPVNRPTTTTNCYQLGGQLTCTSQ